MANIDNAHFKQKLEDELKVLEGELQSVGRRNPSNPADWEPVPTEMNIQHADKNEEADKIEQYEENTAVLKELEIRYNNVKLALEKIEKGTYGKCEISGEDIELDRLEANPAARTCKTHMESSLSE
jgi:RNA polymerase-binding transcription factor DksA